MQHVSARQDRYEEGEVPKFTCRHVTVVAWTGWHRLQGNRTQCVAENVGVVFDPKKIWI
jgi:hypothetical protein